MQLIVHTLVYLIAVVAINCIYTPTSVDLRNSIANTGQLGQSALYTETSIGMLIGYLRPAPTPPNPTQPPSRFLTIGMHTCSAPVSFRFIRSIPHHWRAPAQKCRTQPEPDIAPTTCQHQPAPASSVTPSCPSSRCWFSTRPTVALIMCTLPQTYQTRQTARPSRRITRVGVAA